MTETETETETGFPATLDLSTADTSGNKMENGWKDALVIEVNPVLTENPDGKLPIGTPGLNIQFKIDGGQYDNRRVFNRYWMPAAGYDPEKRARSLGMLVRMLIALGFPEDQVKSANFDMASAMQEMVGRACKVNTKYNEEWDNNNVTGVKARSEGSGGGLL